jgi:hypothetical protein
MLGQGQRPDHGMPRLDRVVAVVAELGFAAAHVPALGADAKAEPAAAVLAGVSPGAGCLVWDVFALLACASEQPHDRSFAGLGDPLLVTLL